MTSPSARAEQLDGLLELHDQVQSIRALIDDEPSMAPGSAYANDTHYAPAWHWEGTGSTPTSVAPLLIADAHCWALREHIQGIASLVGHNAATLSVVSLSRTCVEAAGRICALLDSQTTPAARYARALNDAHRTTFISDSGLLALAKIGNIEIRLNRNGQLTGFGTEARPTFADLARAYFGDDEVPTLLDIAPLRLRQVKAWHSATHAGPETAWSWSDTAPDGPQRRERARDVACAFAGMAFTRAIAAEMTYLTGKTLPLSFTKRRRPAT